MSSSKQSPDDSALASALRYAGACVRSFDEVLSFLRRRGFPPQAASRAVKAAAALGVVDDRACARLWCGHWARRGFAASAIEEKLIAKRINSGAIDEALAELRRSESDETRARHWLSKTGEAPSRAPAQAARRLAARGFDESVIQALIKDIKD